MSRNDAWFYTAGAGVGLGIGPLARELLFPEVPAWVFGVVGGLLFIIAYYRLMKLHQPSEWEVAA